MRTKTHAPRMFAAIAIGVMTMASATPAAQLSEASAGRLSDPPAARLAEGPASAGPTSAQPDLMVVSTEWLAANLRDPGVVVIATGDRDDFDRGHIPGASFIEHMETVGGDHRLLPPEQLAEALARRGADDGRRVVLYGDHAMSTGWLYMVFASIGHADHVSMLSGNIEAWRQEGRAVSTEPASVKPGRLTVKPAPNVIVTAPWVKDRLEQPKVTIIDVRTDREWNQGRLPGATLVLWQDLFQDLETLRFKSRAEIQALFGKAGVRDDAQVVTYCAIGMRASLMYFAARYAGFDGRVYVGSWDDWRRQPGYPIVR